MEVKDVNECLMDFVPPYMWY